MDIFEEVKSLSLPPGKYAVFGSGPLEARGIRRSSDIDIIATEDVYEKLKNEDWEEGSKKDPNKKQLIKKHFEIYATWSFGGYAGDIEKLIKEADIIKGVPFVKLEEVLRWKKAHGRKKDLNDIELVESFYKKTKNQNT